MNLVDLIKDQLSSGLMKELSSHLGANEGATRSAAIAAVPALLSALSGLASSGGAGAAEARLGAGTVRFDVARGPGPQGLEPTRAPFSSRAPAS